MIFIPVELLNHLMVGLDLNPYSSGLCARLWLGVTVVTVGF
jgi:hypothetical protein